MRLETDKWILTELDTVRRNLREQDRVMLDAANELRGIVRRVGFKLPDSEKDELYRVIQDLENSTSLHKPDKKKTSKQG